MYIKLYASDTTNFTLKNNMMNKKSNNITFYMLDITH